MKRILIALITGMLLTASMPAMATRHYSHKHKAAATTASSQAAKAKADSATAIVAFSDTTDNDSDMDDEDNDSTYAVSAPWNQMKEMRGMMNDALLPIAVVFIIFFMAPAVIIGLIVYLIIKSRNQKLRLAEIAMRNGQPIPEFIKKKEKDLRAKGLKHIFIGVGLAVAMLIMGIDSAWGIGIFLAIYGCGEYVIAITTQNKNSENDAASQGSEPKQRQGTSSPSSSNYSCNYDNGNYDFTADDSYVIEEEEEE